MVSINTATALLITNSRRLHGSLKTGSLSVDVLVQRTGQTRVSDSFGHVG